MTADADSKPLGPGHGPAVSSFLRRRLYGGSWSVQELHDGIGVSVGPYDEARVLLALQDGGYIYTTVRDEHEGLFVKITHKQMGDLEGCQLLPHIHTVEATNLLYSTT